MRRFAVLACLLLSAGVASAQQLVAPTGPNTPEEQRKMFKLPPGFEIQLVASEPDVNKPMNLKFDARGRLWVTHSLEYPFAAKEGAKPRDSITVFSDLGENGKAKTVEKFATGLNIPIGILPLNDKETIAWSIPNLYRFFDHDGDGQSDEKEVAFGPFGYTDTHGNQNGLTRWLDGWVYACHGFNNHSQVKIGGEGKVVMELRSGNTYRFRPDGSRIEQISWGQVNPFGLCFDPLGNMFTADCHSRPVTMVLRGGYYQSFGAPHDGLGFAPEATHVDHGGTGIAGVAYYAAEHFPKNYRDVLFVGNVITNKIHCDRIQWNGSTPWIEKVEDFLTCDDPWFRPVDVQLGPDGALYVLDFYNKIIGHYEVPLTHPERDRERGRVWRIVYKGEDGKEKPGSLPNFREAPALQLLVRMGNDNLTLRTMATNEFVDRFPLDADLERTVRQLFTEGTSEARAVHAMWVLARNHKLNATLAGELAKSSRLVRTHLVHALAEAEKWDSWHFSLVRERLADEDPFVRRAAAAALARHPHVDNIPGLCKIIRETREDDTQLIHMAKIALRNHLRDLPAEANFAELKLEEKDYQTVLQIAALAPQGAAAALIYEAALRGDVDDALLAKALPAAARTIDISKVDGLIAFTNKRYASDPASKLVVLRGLHEGLAQRGIAAPEKLKTELTEAVRSSLAGVRQQLWTNRAVEGAAPSASPWVKQAREYTDGAKDIPVVSSLHSAGPGERLTGILVSPKFKLPGKLTFFMCGHNGLPTTKDAQKNYIRLVLEDGTEVARSYPPRNDVAHPFTWDLKDHEGKIGQIDVVDNFVADGYAWIAVSRFDPPVVRIPEGPVDDPDAARADLLRLAGQLKLAPLSKEIRWYAHDLAESPAVRIAACDALLSLIPEDAIPPLNELVGDAAQPTAARQQAAELLGRIDHDKARAALVAQLKTAPQPVAVTLATSLSGNRTGGEALLAEIKAGRASAALLREPTVVAKLKTANIEKLDDAIKQLTANLSPADDRIAQLMQARKQKFLAGKFDPDAGKAIFAKSACAQCHKIGETGSSIAPALDGIGLRGLDRLLEDVFDPNRNVDQAFRQVTITTTDGKLVSGFGLREEGETLLLYDAAGKTVRVQLADIDERSPSTLSPMPANLSEQIPESDFYPLLAYLLSQQAKKE